MADIVRQLRAHDPSRPLSLRKKVVSHEVPRRGDLRFTDDKLDLSSLTEILLVDPVERICVAESGVTFVQLVHATLAHGLLPCVVPELKEITLGGAVAGCSLESMSFVRGGFHDSCLEYEVITTEGKVLTCTPDNQHRLVFQMVHGTFGTLGILSRLVFKLIPAKPFVHVRYEHHGTLAAYLRAIEGHFQKRDVDFMDGIIHSPSHYVLSVGSFADAAPYAHRYDWVKVYFKSTARRSDDYLRTADYVFRYDRGVTNVRPRSLPARLLLGKVMSSRRWLELGERLHRLLRSRRPTVTVDLFLPISKVPEFMAWYERQFGFFPLWCVPYRRVRDYEWLDESFYAGLKDTLFIDLAIYGMRQHGPQNAYRLLELKLRELGGVKTLISHNYYSEAEFWSIWNKRNYDRVKVITDPRNLLRDLYAKTCKAGMGLR